MRTWVTVAFWVSVVGFVPTMWASAQSEPGLAYTLEDGSTLSLGGTARSFNRNDHRIQWSGVESTFGVEGVLRTVFESAQGPVTWRMRGEFFLNQPYSPSLLSDPVRDLYRANFTIPAFQIFQLALEAERGDWLVRLGRIRTPLGGYDVPMLTNSLLDAPFLMTEIIGFAETGAFLRWRPGVFSVDLGISNGETEMDTNSSKALLARVGMWGDSWAAGVWIKAQDGLSSEQQKRFNSFVGFDAQVKLGNWTVYGAGLLDEHGLYRDINQFGNPYALGVRSLYGRDVNRGFRQPSHGGGFHVGATLRRDRLLFDASYGVYWPQQIGIPSHDQPLHRTLFKVTWNVAKRFDLYVIAIRENVRPQPILELYNYGPRALVVGGQCEF